MRLLQNYRNIYELTYGLHFCTLVSTCVAIKTSLLVQVANCPNCFDDAHCYGA